MESKNPRYNALGTIDLEINHPLYGWVPFTASPDDVDPTCQELYARALAGEFGEIAPYVTPPAKPLEVQIAEFTKKIDADVDAIYRAAIGNRATEYAQAEAEATAYKAAGYSGLVPTCVGAWATATGNTPKWAADDILAASVKLRTAQAQIRLNRLTAKESARKATTDAELETVQSQWGVFVVAITAQLGAS